MNNKLNPIIPLIGEIYISLNKPSDLLFGGAEYIDQGVPTRARLSKKNKRLRELMSYMYSYFHEEIFEPYE